MRKTFFIIICLLLIFVTVVKAKPTQFNFKNQKKITT